jgi:hypothetical protein
MNAAPQITGAQTPERMRGLKEQRFTKPRSAQNHKDFGYEL